MTRRSLGHIELEWECPKCGARNAGSSRICNGCGAPQPDHVEFRNPAAAQIIEDEAKRAQAAAGPDLHCPYCNARNPSGATLCVQCGGDLTDALARARGQVLGALNDDPNATIQCRVCNTENPAAAFTCTACGAPLRADEAAAAPATSAAKKKGGCSLWGIGAVVVGILLAIGALFFFFTGSSETVVATVVEAQWNRTIAVEGLAPVIQEAWREQIPSGASIVACREEVQRTVDEPVANSREVCGTPFVEDEGTGFGEVVQECRFEVLADYCSYEVLEWRRVNDIQLSGVGHDLSWPEIVLAENQREGPRSQSLQCVLSADGRNFTYRTPNETLYAACVPNARWQLELNRAGGINRATPQ